jgi:glutathione S-transferase
MPLTFYYASGSPYTWRVWLALEHKGLAYDFRLLSFDKGDLKTPRFRALNPRGKVPVIDDNGFVLYESAAIVEYLEDRYPTPERPLFPADLRRRAVVRRMVREIDEYFAGALERLLDQIFFTPKEKWDANAIADAAKALRDEMAFWEGGLAGEFLAGDLSAADFALYPLIALVLRGEQRQPDLGLGFKAAIGARLGGWMRRVEALPYFAKTLPPHWKT